MFTESTLALQDIGKLFNLRTASDLKLKSVVTTPFIRQFSTLPILWLLGSINFAHYNKISFLEITAMTKHFIT